MVTWKKRVGYGVTLSKHVHLFAPLVVILVVEFYDCDDGILDQWRIWGEYSAVFLKIKFLRGQVFDCLYFSLTFSASTSIIA